MIITVYIHRKNYFFFLIKKKVRTIFLYKMPTEKPFRHRAGLLKQSNKAFKSKHATKRAIKDRVKGLIF